jgi:hypothetical protein
LRESVKVGRLNVSDIPLVNVTWSDEPGPDEPSQPFSGEGVMLVVIGTAHLTILSRTTVALGLVFTGFLEKYQSSIFSVSRYIRMYLARLSRYSGVILRTLFRALVRW